MVIMMKRLLLIPFILWCVCCHAGEPCQTLQFRDSGVKEAFKKTLKEAGIMFSEEADGSITYSPQDKKRVCNIKQDLLIEYYVPPKQYFDMSRQEKLIALLDKAGIHYESFDDHGNRFLTWLKKDDAAVNEIEHPKKLLKVYVGDPDMERQFLKKLDAAKIKHTESRDENGRRWISWNPEDEKKASEIFEKMQKRSETCDGK